MQSGEGREGEVVLSDNRFATLPDKEIPLIIQKGDVLINGTGVGTIGRSAPHLHEHNAIPDNHVTILRTDKLNPIFLSVYLNSIAGKYQVDKNFKGSSDQIELYPKDIDCFYVPLVDKAVQTEIDALVRQSFTLKAESNRLLDIAKRAVEIAIEQDEPSAISFLETTAAVAKIQTIRSQAKQLRAEAAAEPEQAKREIEAIILGEAYHD